MLAGAMGQARQARLHWEWISKSLVSHYHPLFISCPQLVTQQRPRQMKSADEKCFDKLTKIR